MALARAAGVVGVVGADQASKLAGGRLDAVPGVVPLRNPATGLQLVAAGRWPEAALMLLGVVLAACWLLPRAHGRRDEVAAVLLLGGATGNLVDRLTLGGVRDFLAFGPVVGNLADLAVVAGLALWLLARSPWSHRSRPGPPYAREKDGGR